MLAHAGASSNLEGNSSNPSSILECGSTEGWTADGAERFKGLVVAKKWSQDECKQFQAVVEQLAASLPERNDMLGHAFVNLKDRKSMTPAQADELVQRAAVGLVADLKAKAPQSLHDNNNNSEEKTTMGAEFEAMCALIESDARAIACTLDKIHDLNGIVMRLENAGLNTCNRWHQDNYAGRAIVTYSGRGTQYQQDTNVDWGKLKSTHAVAGDGEEHTNDPIIDTERTCEMNAGDILFMRGQYSKAGGLVHRSPPLAYWADGSVMNRLCLKVDVPEACIEGWVDPDRPSHPVGCNSCQ